MLSFYSFAIILVYFLTYLSTLLLGIILCCNISCYVCFVIVCFSFSVLSQEIGWEERLQNELNFCRVERKTTINPCRPSKGFQEKARSVFRPIIMHENQTWL